jgi:hypothetical protein
LYLLANIGKPRGAEVLLCIVRIDWGRIIFTPTKSQFCAVDSTLDPLLEVDRDLEILARIDELQPHL